MKFNLNDFVLVKETGAIGKVTERAEEVDGKEITVTYTVSFIDTYDYGRGFNEEDLERTKLTEVTLEDGKTKAQRDEAVKVRKEKEAKNARISNAMSRIKSINVSTFVKPSEYKEAVVNMAEDVLRFELYGENPMERSAVNKAYDFQKSIYGGLCHGVPIYVTGNTCTAN